MPVLPGINADKIILGAPVAVTITSGAIAVTDASFYIVAPEGAGVTDDLDTITGGTVGQVIVLFCVYTEGTAEFLTVKNAADYIPAANKIALSDNADFDIGWAGTLTLIHDGVGWREIGRSTRSYF